MLLQHLNFRAEDVHNAFQAAYNSGYEHPLYQAWNMANEATAICLTSKDRNGAKISSAPQQYLKISRYHDKNNGGAVRRLMDTSLMAERAISPPMSITSLSPGDAASPASVTPFVSPLQHHRLFADSSPLSSVSLPFDDFDFDSSAPQAASTPSRHRDNDAHIFSDLPDTATFEANSQRHALSASSFDSESVEQLANMSISDSESLLPAQDVPQLPQAVQWDPVDIDPAVLAGRAAIAERYMPVTPPRPPKEQASRYKSTDIERMSLKMTTEYVIPDFIFFVSLPSQGKRFQYPIVLEEIKPLSEREESRDEQYYAKGFYEMEEQCFMQAMLAFTEFPKSQAHWDAIFILMVVADRFKMLKVKRPTECPQTKAECEIFVKQNLDKFRDELSTSVLPWCPEGFPLLKLRSADEQYFSKEWFQAWKIVGQECQLNFNFEEFYDESEPRLEVEGI